MMVSSASGAAQGGTGDPAGCERLGLSHLLASSLGFESVTSGSPLSCAPVPHHCLPFIVCEAPQGSSPQRPGIDTHTSCGHQNLNDWADIVSGSLAIFFSL